MTDLIQRLKEKPELMYKAHGLMDEAAEEIQKLRKSLEFTREVLCNADKDISQLEGALKKVSDIFNDMSFSHAGALCSMNETAKKALDELTYEAQKYRLYDES